MTLSKPETKFQKALAFILKMEGGFVDHPADKGNATNIGITQNTYNSFRLSGGLPKRSVKYITSEEVESIYYNRYWLPIGCDLMPDKLATVVFDVGINQGIAKPFEYLQELVGTKENKFTPRLINDINYYISKHGEDDLVQALLSRRKLSYRRYAAKGNQVVFLQGWLNRVSHLEHYLEKYQGGIA